ncbi:MAG: hypothetical protein K8L97_20755 [Anaerolineae bacterium]|nr:hypothetical protein [Anaerolineae bacterium]
MITRNALAPQTPYWMGIDGGGSNLRVVITDSELNNLAQSQNETANPAVIGYAASAERIQTTIIQTLAEADLSPSQISAVAIGIAGASAVHSTPWLREIISAVLPNSHIVPSSDFEIALVGAHGERHGVLLLAGTGSVAYGLDGAGQSAQVGGWGYLLGDEGSGYWIGMRVLQHIVRAADARGTFSAEITAAVLRVLGLQRPSDLLDYLYRPEKPPVRDVARLASLVMDFADDPIIAQILDVAADELALLCHAVIRRLNLASPRIAFAGGLLETENAFSRRVCDRLNLSAHPISRYSPVIGAALLARLTTQS